ncbi:MAG: hypothetical protein ACE5FD_07385 [Anaerolineae bacterium]
MTPQTSTTATAVFVIRIWQEVSLNGGRWYGRIEWLNTKQTHSFRDLAQLNQFLQATGLFDETQIEGKT